MKFSLLHYFALLFAALGGATVTLKLLFGVWVPKDTHGAIVAVLTALGVMLAVIALPSTVRAFDEAAEMTISIYEKYRDRITGYSRPKLTPYATVCTPEGGWKNVHDAIFELENSGIVFENYVKDLLRFHEFERTTSKKCYDLHLSVSPQDIKTACNGTVLFAFLLESKKRAIQYPISVAGNVHNGVATYNANATKRCEYYSWGQEATRYGGNIEAVCSLPALVCK